MDDLIGVLIFIGFIVISIISKLTRKSGEETDGRSIEERLEEAIRRSKERARAQAGGEPPASRPAPQPSPRPDPARAEARTRARTSVPSAPRPAPPLPRQEQRRAESPTVTTPIGASERPTPVLPPSPEPPPARRAPGPARPAGPIAPRRTETRTPVASGSSRRLMGPEAVEPPPKKTFTRRELRELIIFSELMKRPRIIRNHPMYRRLD